jgi:hypothetical protein
MSLIGSLLALVVFPLKARPQNLSDPKPMPAPELESLALDFWRNAYAKLEAENERLREELRNTREHRDWLAGELSDTRRRYEGGLQAQMQQQSYQGLGQLAQQVQANALMAQQAQMLQQNYYPAQQGALDEFMRNCVPSRAQVFTPAVNGG